MSAKKDVSRVFALFVFSILLFSSTQAYAWSDHGRHGNRYPSHYQSRHYDHQHHHYRPYRISHYPRVVAVLPTKYFTIVFGGSRYYYCDGFFYRRAAQEYVVVEPPIGAVVRTLPSGHTRVIVNHSEYYVSNGVYYRPTRGGYQVETDPYDSPAVLQTVSAVTTQTNSADQDSFTVNVPNPAGGYRAITFTRSGTGFVGPQGEFYSEFPTVEQMQVMYAK